MNLEALIFLRLNFNRRKIDLKGGTRESGGVSEGGIGVSGWFTAHLSRGFSGSPSVIIWNIEKVRKGER